MGYSADDYFNMVYELITNRSDVNLDDLSGTELEAAETALFKESIAESIRATMWLGDTDRADKLNTFDGFLKRLTADAGETENDIKNVSIGATFATDAADAAEALLKQVWDNASDLLKAFKSQGNLVYLSRPTSTPNTKRSSTMSSWNQPIWPNRTAVRVSHSAEFQS